MITLTVNGDKTELEKPVSILEFLESRGVNSKHAAVAVNMVILNRDLLAEIQLADGDKMEIVHAVGGG